MRSFALLVLTDGRRDCFEPMMNSLAEATRLDWFEQRLVIDDSADRDYHSWLVDLLPKYECGFVVKHHAERRGFAGAIRSAWGQIDKTIDYVWHAEDDFTFNQFLPLGDMADVLEENSHIAQLALLRQPWNETERAAGGIIQSHPEDYTECHDEMGHAWVEQRRFWTTNPSLYRAQLTRDREWPDVEHSEGHFSIELFKDPSVCSAFWGRKGDAPRVTHIGTTRIGTRY